MEGRLSSAALTRGAWIRGEIQGPYVGAAKAHGATELKLRRGLITRARLSGPPTEGMRGDETSSLRQTKLNRCRIEVVDKKTGRLKTKRIGLRHLVLTDWTTSAHGAGASGGRLSGQVYAQVRPSWFDPLWLLFLLALLLLLLWLWNCLPRSCEPAQGCDPAVVDAGPIPTELDAGRVPSGDRPGGGGSSGSGSGAGDAPGDAGVGGGGGGGGAGGAGGGGAGGAGPTAPPGAGTTVDEAIADPASFFEKCEEPLLLDAALLFDLNQDKLKPSSLQELGRLKTLLESRPTAQGKKDSRLQLQVYGHADPRGTERHNKKLSYRRAKRVADWLAKEKVARRKDMKVRGRGEREPVVPADAPEEQQRWNRRVEIKIVCP